MSVSAEEFISRQFLTLKKLVACSSSIKFSSMKFGFSKCCTQFSAFNDFKSIFCKYKEYLCAAGDEQVNGSDLNVCGSGSFPEPCMVTLKLSISSSRSNSGPETDLASMNDSINAFSFDSFSSFFCKVGKLPIFSSSLKGNRMKTKQKVNFSFLKTFTGNAAPTSTSFSCFSTNSQRAASFFSCRASTNEPNARMLIKEDTFSGTMYIASSVKCE